MRSRAQSCIDRHAWRSHCAWQPVAADADLSHLPTMRWPTRNGPRYIFHAGRSSLAMGQPWTGMWVIAALASTPWSNELRLCKQLIDKLGEYAGKAP